MTNILKHIGTFSCLKRIKTMTFKLYRNKSLGWPGYCKSSFSFLFEYRLRLKYTFQIIPCNQFGYFVDTNFSDEVEHFICMGGHHF